MLFPKIHISSSGWYWLVGVNLHNPCKPAEVFIPSDEEKLDRLDGWRLNGKLYFEIGPE